MQIFLFLIFIAVPVIEIALFIEAGQVIGVLPTIAITIGTAIAGSFLMRVQGFATLSRFSEAVEKGQMPVTPVIDGIGILTAGLLLLTPGLFTDTIGLLLFVPPVRRGLAKWVFSKALKNGRVNIRTFGGATGAGTGPAGPRTDGPTKAGAGFKKSDDVIDAEFETIDPEPPKNGAAPHDGDAAPPGIAGGKRSPWRKQ